jgi:hypothetical protein
MQTSRTEISPHPNPIEIDASGPRHISHVLREWMMLHEAALAVEPALARPMPQLPVSCEALALPLTAVV